jgi:hypothetical protein
MTTGQLILIIVLVLVAAVLVALIVRWASRRRAERRVEAEGLRSEAQSLEAAVAGQQAFAEQAQERAGVARAEADQKTREAERLESEASDQYRTAQSSLREYEEKMRRADDLDPDVKESEYPPVAETGRTVPDPDDEREATAAREAAPTAHDEPLPMTRAERRRAREESEERGEGSALDGGSATAVAGAAGAAAGAASWAARPDDGTSDADEERSARIAAAADYRDDQDRDDHDAPSTTMGGAHETEEATVADHTPNTEDDTIAQDSDQQEVWTSSPSGTEEGMSQTPRDDTADDTDAMTGGEEGAVRSDDIAADAAADAETPHGEWGGPREGDASTHDADARSGESSPGGGDGSGMEMVADTEHYAATEPVLAEDQADPVEPERPDDAGDGPRLASDPAEGSPSDGSADDSTEETTDGGAVVSEGTSDTGGEGSGMSMISDTDAFATTEPALADGSRAETRPDLAEDSVTDHDRTDDDHGAIEGQGEDTAGEQRDWASDEGELLEENRERGDELAADRDSLDEEAGESPSVAGEADSTHAEGDHEDRTGRRVSDFHEIRDGGFGVGSAAPLDGGVQPMDHPVAAYRDTMSYRIPDDAGYDDTEPDVWFYDESAAQRSGFHRSES